MSKTIPSTQKPQWRFDIEHKIWRKQYRSRRYLEHLRLEQLVKRAEDVLTNNLTLNHDLKIGLHPSDKEAGYWGELFTHILEECVLRNIDHRELMAKVNRSIIPKYDWPGLEDAITKVKKTRMETGNFLIKYGQARHLLPMYERGLIRISPASFYDDPSLNPAVRDSELHLHLYSLASEVSLKKLNAETGEEMGKIECEGYIERAFQAPTNYYVYCLSNMFSPRMFGDFEADACLIIHRPIEFVSLLSRTFQRMSNWRCQARLVDYVDPFNENKFRPELFFAKHFRYAYQKEYRAIWLPPMVEDILEPVFLELGNLQEYCELITFPV